jgi:hypothetical protein
MAESLVGTRVYTDNLQDLERPGAYGKIGDAWVVCMPTGELAFLNAGHTITEHPDGTITVSPSILMPVGRGPYWHGYLEHGVWREV